MTDIVVIAIEGTWLIQIELDKQQRQRHHHLYYYHHHYHL